jgi:hypothetical protein
MFDPLFLYSETPVVVQVASNDFNGLADNNRLSIERGRAIIDYLAGRGLDPARFSVQVDQTVSEC